MIRWRFVLTRLIVIVAILMLLRWGLGPVANFLTIRGFQVVTGAKVEIAETRVGLFPPRVQYRGFQIANPRADKDMRNLMQADRIDLVIDGEALLHRRWVARDGRISGLKIDSRREHSGHIDVPSETLATDQSGPSILGELVEIGAAKIQAETRLLLNDLETVRTSKEIRNHWENEYETLTERASELESQIRDIRDDARGIENPLRDWPQLEQTLAKANRARSQLMVVRETIDALPSRFQDDLTRLDRARRMDLKKVEQYVPGDLGENGDSGSEMMGSIVRDQIQRLREYMESGRALANYTVVAPESERGLGIDYQLNVSPNPAILVRRCEIGGSMRADGDTFTVTGILENLTPNPEYLDEPTRARLRIEGQDLLCVEYVRDRRDDKKIDLMTLHWPEMKAKPIHIGNPDVAGITIRNGKRELWVQIRNENDQIEGRLVSKQIGAEVALEFDSENMDAVALTSLQSSLASIDRIEVDASFKGTWREIDLQLNTNLGQVLKAAAQQAYEQQAQDTKRLLAARVNQTYQQQNQELQKWLGSQQSAARELLAGADKSIEEMSKKVLDEVGDADAYLGRLRGVIRGRIK